MKSIEEMLLCHPQPDSARSRSTADALMALTTCAQICSSCADACLAETGHLDQLQRCIRLNLDCADVCVTTARLVARQMPPSTEFILAQLHACALGCQLCAEECERHAPLHEHCEICADTCRHGAARCDELMADMRSARAGVPSAQT